MESRGWCSGWASCSGCPWRTHSLQTPPEAQSGPRFWFWPHDEGLSRVVWQRSRLPLWKSKMQTDENDDSFLRMFLKI